MEEIFFVMNEIVFVEFKWKKNILCRVYYGLNIFCGVFNERNIFFGVCKGRINIFFVGCYGKKKDFCSVVYYFMKRVF